MKSSLVVLAAVIVAGAIVAAAILSYNAAYPVALAEGRTTGYRAGETTGFNRGEIAGYEKGYAEGSTTGLAVLREQAQKAGFADGQSLGYAEGYREGNADGEFTGYKRGYREGYDAGRLADVSRAFILRDPSIEEITSFLKNDNTSTRAYVQGLHDDKYFAGAVCNAAAEHGFRCAYVMLVFTDSTTHALVAFRPDDTLKFFEPRTDGSIKVAVNDLWEDGITGDTKRIRDILVVW